MSEPTAKAFGTVGIWVATAFILVLGVFRANWNGDVAMFMMLVIVVVVCAASAISTAAVWGWRGSNRVPDKRQQEPELGTEPGAPPKGGPAMRPGDPGAGGGPPSVS